MKPIRTSRLARTAAGALLVVLSVTGATGCRAAPPRVNYPTQALTQRAFAPQHAKCWSDSGRIKCGTAYGRITEYKRGGKDTSAHSSRWVALRGPYSRTFTVTTFADRTGRWVTGTSNTFSGTQRYRY